MALVLNTNSYVEIADADTYFETRIDSAEWTSATDEIKEQALVTASQLVDNHAWIGSAVSSSQALAWPRKNAIYNDDRLGLQVTIAENEVPSRVKTAVYEQALHLVNNEDLLAGTTQTFESISVGSISLTDSNSDVTRTSISPSVVMKPIRPLIRRGTSGPGSGWWRAN
jgi:hypothetical protein